MNDETEVYVNVSIGMGALTISSAKRSISGQKVVFNKIIENHIRGI